MNAGGGPPGQTDRNFCNGNREDPRLHHRHERHDGCVPRRHQGDGRSVQDRAQRASSHLSRSFTPHMLTRSVMHRSLPLSVARSCARSATLCATAWTNWVRWCLSRWARSRPRVWERCRSSSTFATTLWASAASWLARCCRQSVSAQPTLCDGCAAPSPVSLHRRSRPQSA